MSGWDDFPVVGGEGAAATSDPWAAFPVVQPRVAPVETTTLGAAPELVRGIPAGAVSGFGGMLQGAGAFGEGLSRDVQGVALHNLGRQLAETNIAIQRLTESAQGEENPALQARTARALNRLAAERDALMIEIDTFQVDKTAPQDTTLYQAGSAVQDYAKGILPARPGYEDSTARQVGEGLGSLAPYLAAAALPGGPVIGAAAGVLQGQGEAAQRAVTAGATDEQVIDATVKGALPGATEMLPAELLVRRLPGPLGRVLGEAIQRFGGEVVSRVVARAGEQAVVEALQEGGSTALQNLIEQEYNAERQIGDGVIPAAGIGGGVGGIVGGFAGLVGGRRGSAQPEEAPAEEQPFAQTGTRAQRAGAERATPQGAPTANALGFDPSVTPPEAPAAPAALPAPPLTTPVQPGQVRADNRDAPVRSPLDTREPTIALGGPTAPTENFGVSLEDAAVLMAAGDDPADIVAMSPAERRQSVNDALADGVTPLPTEEAATRLRAVVDTSLPDSPRLSPSDRASPLPNALIDEGKALLQQAAQPSAPVAPAQPLRDIASMGQAPAPAPTGFGAFLRDAPVETGTSGTNAPPAAAPAPSAPQNAPRTASWVIRDRASGEVVMETFDKKAVDALNTEKFEAVPVQQYLASLNTRAPDGTLNQRTPETPSPQQAPEGAPSAQSGQPVAPGPDAPAASTPSYDDFRAVLPKDSAGNGDVAAGARIVKQIAGNERAFWKNLTDEQKRQAVEVARGQTAPATPAAPSAPAAPASTSAPAPTPRKPRRVATVSKYPVLMGLKRSGGVDPDGWLAGELRNMGVTNKTLPGLFRRGGMKTPDNLPYDPATGEEPVIRGKADADGGMTYLDPDDFVEAIREELAGMPRYTARERDIVAAKSDDRAVEQARDRVEGAAADMGVTLSPPEIDLAVAEFVRLGGDPQDVIVEVLERSPQDDAEGYDTSRADDDLGDIPFDIDQPSQAAAGEGDARRDNRGARNDARARADDDQRAERNEGVQGQAVEPGPDGGQQLVVPGAEASATQAQAAQSARGRAEIDARQKQSRIGRLDQERVEDGEGGLFGAPKRDLFDAPAASARPAQPALSNNPTDMPELGGKREGGMRYTRIDGVPTKINVDAQEGTLHKYRSSTAHTVEWNDDGGVVETRVIDAADLEEYRNAVRDLNATRKARGLAPLGDAPAPASQKPVKEETAAAPTASTPADAPAGDGVKKTAPLYVDRPVLNADEIVAWARSQGFKSTLAPEDMHVTVVYSREPVDASAVPAQTNEMSAPVVSVKRLGDKGAVVLSLNSQGLQDDHRDYRNSGASSDYPTYQPHVTITYDAGDVDLKKVTVPDGLTVRLGGERQKPLDPGAGDDVREVPTGATPASKPTASDPTSPEAAAWWKSLPREEREAELTRAGLDLARAKGGWGFIAKSDRTRILAAPAAPQPSGDGLFGDALPSAVSPVNALPDNYDTLPDVEKIRLRRDELVTEIVREMERERRARLKMRAQGKRSKASINQDRIASMFGLSVRGGSPLDMILGGVILGDVMGSAMGSTQDVRSRVGDVVDAYLAPREEKPVPQEVNDDLARFAVGDEVEIDKLTIGRSRVLQTFLRSVIGEPQAAAVVEEIGTGKRLTVAVFQMRPAGQAAAPASARDRAEATQPAADAATQQPAPAANLLGAGMGAIQGADAPMGAVPSRRPSYDDLRAIRAIPAAERTDADNQTIVDVLEGQRGLTRGDEPPAPTIEREQRNPVEQPLYVVHNLSAEKLRHVVDLGGLAAPSLAVARGDIGFNEFGEISLIGEPDMADPRAAGQRAFNADVYSPRQPRARFDVNRRGTVALERALGPAAAKLQMDVSSEIRDDRISDMGLDAIAESDIAKLAFLDAQGVEIEPVMKARTPKPAAFEPFTETKTWELTNNPDFAAAVVRDVEERIADLPEDLRAERREMLLDSTGAPAWGTLDRAARKVAEANGPTRVDTYETGRAIRAAMDGRETEFRDWISDNFADVLGAHFFRTDSGRRKPYTMENLVREMKRTLRDGEGWNYGAGSVRANVAKEFKSLSGMKADRGAIVDDETMKRVKDEANDEMLALAQEFAPYHGSGKDFGWDNIFSEFLKDLSRGRLSEWQRSIFDRPAPPELVQKARDFLDKLRNAPTGYFEIKAQRPVALSEFTAALIPSDASPATRSALEAAGLEIVTYDQDGTNDRNAALQRVLPRVAFQRAPAGWGSIDVSGPPIPAITAEQAAALRERVTRVAGERVGLNITNALREAGPARGQKDARGAQGAYSQRGTDGEVILYQAVNPERTIDHELIHALKNLGLFTDAEWTILSNRARDQWKRKFRDHLAAYREADEALLIEEAVAEAFAQRMQDNKTEPMSVRRLLSRLADVIEAIQNWAQGLGLQSSGGILRRADRGDMAGRDVREGGAVERERIDTRAAAFRRWFGDSVLRNADGSPRVMYHGTTSDFEEFGRTNDIGFHVGTDLAANDLLDSLIRDVETGERILPVYVSIKNPFRTDDIGDWNASEMLDAMDSAGLGERRALSDEVSSIMARENITPRQAIVRMLEARGYDGIVYENMEEGARYTEGGNGQISYTDSYIAFRPEQIKSIFNRGTWNPDSPKILERRAPAPTAPFATFEAQSSRALTQHFTGMLLNPKRWREFADAETTADFRNMMVRTFQDRMTDLKRQQDAIVKATGKAIQLAQDAYTAESLYYGRAGDRLEKFHAKHVKPIMAAIRAAGLSREAVDDFLAARHAEERNAQIAKLYGVEDPNHQFVKALTDADVVGGSGMSANEARAILNRATPALRDIGARVDRMLAEKQATEVASGLKSQEQADAENAAYRHYVPLRGFEADPDEGPGASAGRGFDARGKDKRAMGRRTKADSPLGYAFGLSSSAIIKAEKNKVARTLLRLVQANPNDAAWSVDRRETVKTIKQKRATIIDPTTGLPVPARYEQVTERQQPPSPLDPHVMVAKVGGEDVYIRLENRDLATAMKNLAPDSQSQAVAALGKVTRFMSAMNTSFNPEWFAVNIIRDLTTAGIQISDEGQRGMTKRILRDWPKALRGAMQSEMGNPTSQWGRIAEEFKANGGKVNFIDFNTVEDFKTSIEREASRPEWARMLRAGVEKSLGTIEAFTSAGENAIRISAYKAMIDAGAPPAKAASVARELTVNFNRKGTVGPTLNAFYMFFNAAVQGNARLITSIGRSKFTRQALVGLTALGFLEALMGAGDDEYEKIEGWVRERNIVLPLALMGLGEPGEYLKIPVPYGFNVFKTLGTEMGRVTMHGVSPGEAAGNVVAATIAAFAPISGNSFATLVSPTPFDPFVEIYGNENYFGSRIAPDYPNDKRPPSEQYFPNVSPAARTITDALNAFYIPGLSEPGNEYRAGALSMSPEHLEHVFGALTGGLGRLVMRGSQAATELMGGELPEAEKAPFVRNFYGRTFGEMPTWRTYSTLRDRVQAVDYEIKQFSKAGRADEARNARERDERMTRMIGEINRSEKELRRLRGEERRVTTAAMSDEARERQMETLRERMYETQRRAIAAYDRLD